MDNFEEIQLEEDIVCDSCGYTVVRGSIAHQNFEENLIYCSTCWDKARKNA